MDKTPECYGGMFPDLSQVRYNKPAEGVAFRVLITSLGIGVQGRDVEVKRDGWEHCVACERYRDCYDLSMAKLTLHQAVRSWG
jgi:hypothetical protein